MGRHKNALTPDVSEQHELVTLTLHHVHLKKLIILTKFREIASLQLDSSRQCTVIGSSNHAFHNLSFENASAEGQQLKESNNRRGK